MTLADILLILGGVSFGAVLAWPVAHTAGRRHAALAQVRDAAEIARISGGLAAPTWRPSDTHPGQAEQPTRALAAIAARPADPDPTLEDVLAAPGPARGSHPPAIDYAAYADALAPPESAGGEPPTPPPAPARPRGYRGRHRRPYATRWHRRREPVGAGT